MSKEAVSIRDVADGISNLTRWIISKWLIISITGCLFGVGGILYAWFKKPTYVAELTFAPENNKSSGLGAYAGLAAQFGFDIGGGGGFFFEGDNLLEFFKSKMLIETALLTPVKTGTNETLLINHYIHTSAWKDKLRKNPRLSGVRFQLPYEKNDRIRDSVMKEIIMEINKKLIIDRVDKKLSIVIAKIETQDEIFSKLFVETIVASGINYYIDYRSKKSRENVLILERQTDSVRNILHGNIASVASSTDLNVNPIRQVAKTGARRREIDVQANSQLYAELLKQLELSRIALRKETPLIEIIERPYYPLQKIKPGRLKTGIIWGITGVVVAVIILVAMRWFKIEYAKAKV